MIKCVQLQITNKNNDVKLFKIRIMKVKKIIGLIASQPLVVTHKDHALVILVIKSDDGYIEIHYDYFMLATSLVGKFTNSSFSKIATSSIGDTIEAEIDPSNGNMISFENKTRGIQCML